MEGYKIIILQSTKKCLLYISQKKKNLTSSTTTPTCGREGSCPITRWCGRAISASAPFLSDPRLSPPLSPSTGLLSLSPSTGRPRPPAMNRTTCKHHDSAIHPSANTITTYSHHANPPPQAAEMIQHHCHSTCPPRQSVFRFYEPRTTLSRRCCQNSRVPARHSDTRTKNLPGVGRPPARLQFVQALQLREGGAHPPADGPICGRRSHHADQVRRLPELLREHPLAGPREVARWAQFHDHGRGGEFRKVQMEEVQSGAFVVAKAAGVVVVGAAVRSGGVAVRVLSFLFGGGRSACI